MTSTMPQPQSDAPVKAAAKRKKYTELTHSQLQWPHMVLQWICVQLMGTYHTVFRGLKIYGKENCPKEWQPAVVAANHLSSYDPPLVSVALNYRPIAYMAKMELYETFWMRLYNWGMSAFAVNREKLELSTIKTAHKVLKSGKWAVGIFPEGSRNKEGGGEVGESKKGVVYFAKAAKVPIFPVGIAHKDNKTRICVGKPIPSEPYTLDELAVVLQKTLQELVTEAYSKF